MLVKKKSEPSVSDLAPAQVPRKRLKSCGVCGGHFFPRTAFSVFCDFCSTPSSSFLMIREALFPAARAA